MASIRREFVIDAAPQDVWDAVRDAGAVHRRLAPGFVVDCRLEDGARTVTFANGFVARELIVDVDDDTRRIVYSVVGGPATHHNASMQILPTDDGRSRMEWITDLLPHEAASVLEPMVEQGAEVMRLALAGARRTEAGGV
jgi:carbon monoxide dehydrogenase subunit G